MPKKQVYSPVNAAETQHYDEYRDEPGLDQDCSSSNITNTTMPSGAASIKSAISKKSRKSRRIVDNDELSVPLHAMAEGGDDQHEEVQFHDDDLESGGAKGASVSLDDDPFYVFREDLTRKLYLVDDGLKNYLNVIHDTVSEQTLHINCS